ncbi:hypothetical protein [Methylosinus sp. LW4]|nr:hypothetical protein [Methylosinus sp. LW4]
MITMIITSKDLLDLKKGGKGGKGGKMNLESSSYERGPLKKGQERSGERF